MALDPVFATTPTITPAPAGYWGSEAALREDIANPEEEARNLNDTAQRSRKQIPELEREALICERDAAQMRLRALELKAKLAARNGGAQ